MKLDNYNSNKSNDKFIFLQFLEVLSLNIRRSDDANKSFNTTSIQYKCPVGEINKPNKLF